MVKASFGSREPVALGLDCVATIAMGLLALTGAVLYSMYFYAHMLMHEYFVITCLRAWVHVSLSVTIIITVRVC